MKYRIIEFQMENETEKTQFFLYQKKDEEVLSSLIGIYDTHEEANTALALKQEENSTG